MIISVFAHLNNCLRIESPGVELLISILEVYFVKLFFLCNYIQKGAKVKSVQWTYRVEIWHWCGLEHWFFLDYI